MNSRFVRRVLSIALLAVACPLWAGGIEEARVAVSGQNMVIRVRLSEPASTVILKDLVIGSNPYGAAGWRFVKKDSAGRIFQKTGDATSPKGVKVKPGDQAVMVFLIDGIGSDAVTSIVVESLPALAVPAQPVAEVVPPTPVPVIPTPTLPPTRAAVPSPVVVEPAKTPIPIVVAEKPTPVAAAVATRTAPIATATPLGVAEVKDADLLAMASPTPAAPVSSQPPETRPVAVPTVTSESASEDRMPLVVGGGAGALLVLGVILLLVSRLKRTKVKKHGRGKEKPLVTAPSDQGAAAGAVSKAGSDLIVDHLIARGGVCDILAVRRRSSTGTFALKILRPEFENSYDMRTSLSQEADILEFLNQRNPDDIFIQIHGRGEIPENGRTLPYLILEFADGQDLKNYVKKNGPLPADELADLLRALARALAAVHDTGWVHGDISPENLIRLGAKDGRGRWRLIDFGDARTHEDQPARIREIVGKLSYLSPEQTLGFAANQPSDIYSFGMTLFFLVAGHPAFSDSNTGRVLRMHQSSHINYPHGFPEPLRKLVQKLCKKQPSERPISTDLVRLVETALHELEAK